MYQNLDVFRFSHAMASHAGARQSVVAQNIANADTPGYKAREITSFQEMLRTREAGFTPRATRATHLSGQQIALRAPEILKAEGLPVSPDGNTVSIETEMLNGVETGREHARALAIYRTSLSILRTSLGRR